MGIFVVAARHSFDTALLILVQLHTSCVGEDHHFVSNILFSYEIKLTSLLRCVLLKLWLEKNFICNIICSLKKSYLHLVLVNTNGVIQTFD